MIERKPRRRLTPAESRRRRRRRADLWRSAAAALRKGRRRRRGIGGADNYPKHHIIERVAYSLASLDSRILLLSITEV
jgi:hypothetical protein